MVNTRSIHVVRCKKKNPDKTLDDTTFVDVEVTDGVSFVGPNGNRMIINFSGDSEQVPYIIDDIKSGLAQGDAAHGTRQSHIEKIVAPGDPTASLYIEVLDSATFHSPNAKRGMLKFPSSDCGYLVDDKANIGVKDTLSKLGSNHTRNGTTEKVCAKTNTSPATEKTDFIGVLTTGGISFVGPNGDRNIIRFLDPDAFSTVDTTTYTKDSSGNNVPPDNTDPNPYVAFPSDSTTPWVQIGDGSNPMGAIGCAQGPLWRIINADANPGPWWIYTPSYQFYEWSAIGYNWCLVAPFTAERCFPTCDPCTCGCETFGTDVAAPACIPGKNKRWPCIGHDVTVGCGGSDPGPTTPFPLSGFLSANAAALYAQNTDPGACVKVNWKYPPQDRFSFPTLGGTVLSGWRPNIWQITKGKDEAGNDIAQPSHTDPDTGKTVYDDPSPGLAKKIAKLFEQQWNDTTDAYNAGEIAMDGCNLGPCCQWIGDTGSPYSVSLGRSYPSEADDWKFGCAIVDGPTADIHTIGRPDYNSNALDFCGGLPPAGWASSFTDYPCTAPPAYRIWAFHPATAYPIAVVQLDPKVWDTSNDIPKLLPRPPDLAHDAPWPPA